MTRKKRLGRGLEALLNSSADTIVVEHEAGPGAAPPPVATSAADAHINEVHSNEPMDGSTTSDILHLSVYEIDDNPFQPRREFSESEIGSLAESLKEHDILQPILVRVVDGRYQLISGERRLRAAIQANWQTIPARVRTADDRLVSELAIVENLQRKDLNPVEKALSFRRYIDEHRCTQEELAGRLKIDRSSIANLMRLLELPRTIQESLSSGQISAGHARALLPLGDEDTQIEFAQRIMRDGISVRGTEAEVREKITREDTFGLSAATRNRRTHNRQIESLEQDLKTALGTKVRIKSNTRGKGQLVIHFNSHEEFERLRGLLM